MLEYIELAKQSPPHSRGRTSVPCLRGHMFKSLFTAMAARTDLRARLTKARTLEDMVRHRGRGSQHTATDLGVKSRSLSEGPARVGCRLLVVIQPIIGVLGSGVDF